MPHVDLHLHSTASDGAYTPEEVVEIAVGKNLTAIALTDHDTIDGTQPARIAAGERLEVLSGVELSAEDETADRHILGYLFRLDRTSALYRMCIENKQARVRRIEAMIARLAALGVEVPLDEVLALANSGAVGRPHLARVMLRRGVVATLQQAFDRYIGDDGPAYVPHHRLDPAQAIALIHDAGGVAVLAHPGRYPDYNAIIEELIPLGLDGIEVYYPDHTPEIVGQLRRIAQARDLIMTAGSDFHRRAADGSAPVGTAAYPAELDILAALRERAARRP